MHDQHNTSNSSESLQSVDKGIPDLHVAPKKSLKTLVFFGLGILFFLTVAGVSIYRFNSNISDDSATKKEKQNVESVVSRDFSKDKAEMAKIEEEQLPMPAIVATEPIPEAPMSAAPIHVANTVEPQPIRSNSSDSVETPYMRKMGGHVLYDGGDSMGSG